MTLGMSYHPNVVRFYASFLVEDKLWLAMDFLAGGKLEFALAQHLFCVHKCTPFLILFGYFLTFSNVGSVLDIMKFKFQGGLEETVIATILREALKGIAYFHATGRIHRYIFTAISL